jgi:hypothetical protein
VLARNDIRQLVGEPDLFVPVWADDRFEPVGQQGLKAAVLAPFVEIS